MTSEQRLEYLDDLTGLYNRRYFREKLLAEKRNADENGASFALMMIDLDGFKLVNDMHGHLVGDRVLAEVSQVLKESLRPSDILCRYAGDEFVAILPKTTERDVIGIAERIRSGLTSRSWVDDKGDPMPPVTCSLGYAFYAETGRDPTALISWADQALYAAKRRGGNGHCGEKDIPRELAGRPLIATPYLVGREKDLGQLKSMLEGVRRHGGGMVLTHGEMGVGKTRLTRELRQYVERSGGTALMGGCHADTQSIPYYPFREAFRRFLEGRELEGRLPFEVLPEYSQRELARILPGLKDIHLSELERAPDSYRLFEAIRLLLQRISASSGSPVLFIVEDIHWSDKASLDLLHYLVRNLREPPVLIYATYRTEEARRGQTLPLFLSSIHGEKLAEEIVLKPLSPEGVSAMLYLLYPGIKFTPDFHEFLYRKTEGNPFFVEELLKSLPLEKIQEGVTRVEEVPPSLRAVLGTRIDSLSPEMREVLACGALVGEEFEFRVLCEVLDRPLDVILDAMETGTAGHLLVESIQAGEERYSFTHSLMADVLYSSTSKVRRRMWHERVGEVLERLHGDKLERLCARLMYHFEHAENPEKALPYALKAAAQAKDDYANDEAIRLYRRARLMLHRLGRETEDDGLPIAEGLADVYHLKGEFDSALAEYRTLRDVYAKKADNPDEGRVLCRMADVYHIKGDFDDMMELATRAREVYERAENPAGVAASLDAIGNAYFHQGEYDKAMECCEQALEIYRESRNQAGIASSLWSVGIVHDKRGDYDEALKHHQQALGIWRKTGDRRRIASTLTSIGDIYTSLGDYAEALRKHEEALEMLKETGDICGSAECLQSIARVNIERGDFSEALRYAEQSLKIQKEIGSKPGVARSLNTIAYVHWSRGDHEKALEHYDECLSIRREIGDVEGAAKSLHNIGLIHANAGEYEEALRCYLEALETQRDIGDKKGMSLSLHSTGVIHWCRGDYEESLKCHEEGLAIKREMGAKKGVAISLISIGSLQTDCGNYQSALDSLTEALDTQEEIGDNWAKAFTLSELGRLHQALQDPGRARDYQIRSLDLMEEMGLNAEKTELLSAIGYNHHLLGDDARAIEELNGALDTAMELGAKEAEPVALEALSEVCLSMGDTETARKHCERLLGIAEERGLKRYLAAAKRTKGEIFMGQALSSQLSVVSWEEPERELKEALGIAERIGASPLLWQVHESLGKLYERKDDSKKASEHMGMAREIIEQIASRTTDKGLRETYLQSPRLKAILDTNE